MSTNSSADTPSSPSASSGLPSLTSAVSDPVSWLNFGFGTADSRSSSPSLGNYLKGSSSSSTFSYCEDEESETSEESAESSLPDKACGFIQEKSMVENLQFEPIPLVDPCGWIKYSLDPDPWNEEYYVEDSDTQAEDGVLTHEMVQSGLSKMEQLPDTKQFVLTRLHIRNKKLTDTTVLADYHFLQTVDMSDNLLTNLRDLRSCYLLYLNASHNRLTEALDMTPPSFLTHVDLSYNQIPEMGPYLSQFWSLRHLDLSHNLIERIQGLTDLKYLRYLNLSHNQIRRVEGPECENLERLDLQSNLIADCDEDGFHALSNIKDVNVANNRLTSMLPFKDLYTLRRLDLGGNCVDDLEEVDHLTGSTGLQELNLSGNPVTRGQGYREYVLYQLSSLQCLDSVPILASERVATKQLLKPDILTRGDQLRAKIELWTLLAARPVDSDTVPIDRPPLPLVVLVGTFANGRDSLAAHLAATSSDRVYRCKKFTTTPYESYYDQENVVHVSEEEFSHLVKTGQMLVHYKELGVAFGVGREELCRSVAEGKVCLVDTVLEAALAIRSLALRPVLVLAVTADTQGYAGRLRELYTQMGLWGRCRPDPDDDSDPRETKKMSATEDENRSVQTSWDDDASKADGTETALTSESRSSCMEQFLGDHSQENVPGEDDFVWSWSLESSRESLEPEPRESFQDMVRGRERLVQESLREQDAYVQMHNSFPGLFQESVLTDNVGKAARKIIKTCVEIFNMREGVDFMEERMQDLDCKEFLEARVSCLMKDLLNISSEM